MIDYKDYFSDSFDKNQLIIGLLNLGYRADEISEIVKVPSKFFNVLFRWKIR